MAFDVAANLLGLSAQGVRKIFAKVKSNGWQPCPLRAKFGKNTTEGADVSHGVSSGGVSSGMVVNPQVAAMRNMVRVAISLRVEGRPFASFTREMSRYKLAGANVGIRYTDKTFARTVNSIAALVLQQLDGFDINK